MGPVPGGRGVAGAAWLPLAQAWALASACMQGTITLQWCVRTVFLRARFRWGHSWAYGIALTCLTRVSQPLCHRQEAAIAGYRDAVAHERPFSLAMQLRSAGARAPVLHFMFRRAANPHGSFIGFRLTWRLMVGML